MPNRSSNPRSRSVVQDVTLVLVLVFGEAAGVVIIFCDAGGKKAKG